MATFVVLLTWTEQGIKDFKESTQRAERVRSLVESRGGSMPHLYWTVGPYDLVGVVDAPDDETATAMLLEIGSIGSVRSTTLRAFDQAQFEEIVRKTQ